VNIDGNDDAWVANVWGLSVTLRAGDGTKGHPAGTKPSGFISSRKEGNDRERRAGDRKSDRREGLPADCRRRIWPAEGATGADFV
jgi:hypothetical protein